LVQPGREFLTVFLEHVTKFANDTRVFLIDKREGRSSVTSTASTTDTVHIIINVGWEIKVDDISNVGAVK
jgi:hypothetical protein